MLSFDLFFPQFCKSDMSRYGYQSISQSSLDFEITRVDLPKGDVMAHTALDMRYFQVIGFLITP